MVLSIIKLKCVLMLVRYIEFLKFELVVVVMEFNLYWCLCIENDDFFLNVIIL